MHNTVVALLVCLLCQRSPVHILKVVCNVLNLLSKFSHCRVAEAEGGGEYQSSTSSQTLLGQTIIVHLLLLESLQLKMEQVIEFCGLHPQ